MRTDLEQERVALLALVRNAILLFQNCTSLAAGLVNFPEDPLDLVLTSVAGKNGLTGDVTTLKSQMDPFHITTMMVQPIDGSLERAAKRWACALEYFDTHIRDCLTPNQDINSRFDMVASRTFQQVTLAGGSDYLLKLPYIGRWNLTPQDGVAVALNAGVSSAAERSFDYFGDDITLHAVDDCCVAFQMVPGGVKLTPQDLFVVAPDTNFAPYFEDSPAVVNIGKWIRYRNGLLTDVLRKRAIRSNVTLPQGCSAIALYEQFFGERNDNFVPADYEFNYRSLIALIEIGRLDVDFIDQIKNT